MECPRTLLKILYTFFIPFLIVSQHSSLVAQVILIDEMPRPLYYERTKRITKFIEMKSMQDVFHSEKFLLGKNIFSGNISHNMGRMLVDDGSIQHKEFRNALGIFIRAHIAEEYYINGLFYKDYNPNAVQRWTSDFTYSYGRFNWRPKTFSFGYENYANNRYSDNAKVLWGKYLQGNYFISYINNLPQTLMKKLTIDNTSAVRFTYFLRYAINYKDEFEIIHGGLFKGKPNAGISARYTVARNFYLESAIYLYVNPLKQKQPWDPDFSYGFGYFNWKTFRASITYGNWVINRFPWNKNEKKYPQYGFPDGNFRIVFNYTW